MPSYSQATLLSFSPLLSSVFMPACTFVAEQASKKVVIALPPLGHTLYARIKGLSSYQTHSTALAHCTREYDRLQLAGLPWLSCLPGSILDSRARPLSTRSFQPCLSSRSMPVFPPSVCQAVLFLVLIPPPLTKKEQSVFGLS